MTRRASSISQVIWRCFSLGHEKYFDIKDQMEGRRLEQGRLDESMRQADMENARGWANIQNAQLDRAQRAQIHSDEMGLKLMELGQKVSRQQT